VRLRVAAAIAAAAIVGTIAAIYSLPPVLLRDASAPASLKPFVDGARATIRSQAIEGPLFWWPLHLRFVEARCSSTPRTGVALIFEEWRPPYRSTTYAVAWRGSMPTSADGAWGGGIGMHRVYDDEEFVYQMGLNTVVCP
jgi:hypothetical protein